MTRAAKEETNHEKIMVGKICDDKKALCKSHGMICFNHFLISLLIVSKGHLRKDKNKKGVVRHLPAFPRLNLHCAVRSTPYQSREYGTKLATSCLRCSAPYLGEHQPFFFWCTRALQGAPEDVDARWNPSVSKIKCLPLSLLVRRALMRDLSQVISSKASFSAVCEGVKKKVRLSGFNGLGKS